MFAWLPDSSNHPLRSIQDVALDVAAYLRDKRIREDGFVIQALRNPVPLAATMMLIDEPLTEKDTLKTIALNGEIVNIAWVVPVFPNEAEWIRLHGMASFDQLREQSSQNLFRLDRRSMIDTVA